MTMNDPMNEAGWIGRIPKIPMVDEASRAGFVETLAVLEEECGMSIDFLGRNGFDRRGTLTLEATRAILELQVEE